MEALQDTVPPESYERGSPHLLHAALRTRLVEAIRTLVSEQLESKGRCAVLEIGAGHGAFTDHVLAAGAEVVVSEMSAQASAALQRRLRHNPRVTVVHDRDGEEIFRRSERFDLVLCISVLHHVPDYLGALRRLVEQLEPGGALLSYQDPLFYPRRSALSMKAERAAFLTWRVRQGELRRGVATQARRWRKELDENLPGDMVEYHVVRQGLDEQAVAQLLHPQFEHVSVVPYWSTPSGVLQSLGERFGAANTFAVIARGRRSLPGRSAAPG